MMAKSFYSLLRFSPEIKRTNFLKNVQQQKNALNIYEVIRKVLNLTSTFSKSS